MSLDSGLQIATSLFVLVFGLGAWRAKRESNETGTAAALARLDRRCAHLSKEVDTKVGWKDFDREGKAIRRELELQIDSVGDRIDRLDRKVFNGGGHV